MQNILEQNAIAERVINRPSHDFGKKIGLVAKLFGCRHRRLTRPLTMNKSSYRACVECGARKKFDTETLRTSKEFYYPPAVSFIKD